MSSVFVADLFVEDRAHEEFLKAIVGRLATAERKQIVQRVRSARGGHGKTMSELAIYQKSVEQGVAGMTMPDVLIVGIDSNCTSVGRARTAIRENIAPAFRDRTAIACPDPHVERWYVADPESFANVVGARPRLPRRKKCERGRYKAVLARAVVEAGHPPTLGGIEFAREIVEAMDLYRAGKAERSLKLFLDEATARLRSL